MSDPRMAYSLASDRRHIEMTIARLQERAETAARRWLETTVGRDTQAGRLVNGWLAVSAAQPYLDRIERMRKMLERS